MATNINLTVAVPSEVMARIKNNDCPPHIMQPVLTSLRQNLITAIKSTLQAPTPTKADRTETSTASTPDSNGKIKIKVRIHNVDDAPDWIFEADKQTTVNELKDRVKDEYLDDRFKVTSLTFLDYKLNDTWTMEHASLRGGEVLDLEYDMLKVYS